MAPPPATNTTTIFLFSVCHRSEHEEPVAKKRLRTVQVPTKEAKSVPESPIKRKRKEKAWLASLHACSFSRVETRVVSLKFSVNARTDRSVIKTLPYPYLKNQLPRSRTRAPRGGVEGVSEIAGQPMKVRRGAVWRRHKPNLTLPVHNPQPTKLTWNAMPENGKSKFEAWVSSLSLAARLAGTWALTSRQRKRRPENCGRALFVLV
jgi:hypothetical protein